MAYALYLAAAPRFINREVQADHSGRLERITDGHR
jgi:hypothetical protein